MRIGCTRIYIYIYIYSKSSNIKILIFTFLGMPTKEREGAREGGKVCS